MHGAVVIVLTTTSGEFCFRNGHLVVCYLGVAIDVVVRCSFYDFSVHHRTLASLNLSVSSESSPNSLKVFILEVP